jgi:hypothetical protein
VVPRARADASGRQVSYFVQMQLQAGACVGVEEIWVDEAANVCSRSSPEFVDVPLAPTAVLDDAGNDGD